MIMKNILKIVLITSLCLLALSSCKDDDLDDRSIFDLEEPDKTTFDKWLDDNFLDPFNIRIIYKLDDKEADHSFTLTPANTESSLKMSIAIKHLWVETFVEYFNSPVFLKTYAPRVFHLIGSGGYNNAGTVLAGTAEGGMKITLYRVNNIVKLSDTEISDYYFKTMFHEFFHILHQKKDIGENYEKISLGDYVPNDWYLYKEQEALDLGFITRYSRTSEYEDFVELASVYIVQGIDFWNSKYAQANEEGQAKLSKKLEYVKQYFFEKWEIDLDIMQSIYKKRMNSLEKTIKDNELNF